MLHFVHSRILARSLRASVVVLVVFCGRTLPASERGDAETGGTPGSTGISHVVAAPIEDKDGSVRVVEIVSKSSSRSMIQRGQADPSKYVAIQTLRGLPNLQRVEISYGSELSRADLDAISKLSGLRELVIGFPGVASEYVTIEGGLSSLGQLKQLQVLRFCVDGIQDEDLKFLAELPQLQTLEFRADSGRNEPPVCTDKCAEHLGKATRLKHLDIAGGQFSDAFLADLLQRLPNLESLQVASDQFTDASLDSIAKHAGQLRTLSIASNQFTVQGTMLLSGMNRLVEKQVQSPAIRNHRREVQKFLGEWELESVKTEGKLQKIKTSMSYTITEKDWTRRWSDQFARASWEIDAEKKPKWLTRVTGGGKVNFLEDGIYKFDGDRLIFCESAWVGGDRPTQFSAEKGESQYLTVLRRKKDKDSAE